VSIIATRVEEGVDDEADLARAKTVLAEDALASTAERHNVRVLQNALAVLTGTKPGQLALTASPSQPKFVAQSIGDPGALLQQRPDVVAAERALAAQTAEIGIAKADLFPRISFTGFNTLGPTLSWNVFSLGRVRARVRSERAEAEAAVDAYEQTVLRALEDAQNAFSAYAAAKESLGTTELQLTSARSAAELVRVRYDEGMSGYFELLDARRSAVRAEIGRINSVAAHHTATVDVFRALAAE
jgi:multidrug efflux system outer membrane protein